MKLFLDTANIEDIKRISTWGVLDGVTTNPSLIAKEGKEFVDVLNEITEIVDGPISAEVVAEDHEEMIKQGVELAKLHKNIMIKVPMCEEGLKAIKYFSENGIKTNCTLIFSTNQALLAAKAGATIVSPFAGRLDDIGHDGMELISDICEIFDFYGIETEVIAASIRHPKHVVEAARAGAHIATVPADVYLKMLGHPLTDIGIEKFNKDWEKAQK